MQPRGSPRLALTRNKLREPQQPDLRWCEEERRTCVSGELRTVWWRAVRAAAGAEQQSVAAGLLAVTVVCVVRS
ncbi:hypothetical protein Pmani_033835 [Petrolisthes manimaculis]|uniref:Uncharacterized protein n=1 Tax=Petrolisthes manimaculis TaxID=1843537 RepID=A0AAE1NQK1_9EUCA|nr:hypothetical protein Pmani_033835 [Petrolisthes manimaculis]